MTNIDWSKAPEGATHLDTKFNYFCNKDGFYSSIGYLVPDNDQAGWGTDRYIPRPTEQPQWSGEGLPPVGSAIEVRRNDNDWYKAFVVAHDAGRVVYRCDHDMTTYGWTIGKGFRPIKSERDQQIDALTAIIQTPPAMETVREVAAALYDKGVRVEI
jgi:hypothetical protein